MIGFIACRSSFLGLNAIAPEGIPAISGLKRSSENRGTGVRLRIPVRSRLAFVGNHDGSDAVLALRRIASLVTAVALLGLAAAGSAAGAGHVYAAMSDAQLRAFDITASGSLAPNATPSAASGAGPTGVAISPDGRHAYVANFGGTVSVVDIDATGAPSPSGAPPVATPFQPFEIAVSPDGAHVYVATNDGVMSTNDPIAVYDIGPSGALTPNASPTALAGDRPRGIVVSPDGAHVYVANSSSGTISVLDVGPSGALTPASTTSAVGALSLAISPDGRHLYAPDGATSVRIFDIAPTGSLSVNPASPATLPGGQAFWAATSPDGRGLFIPENTGPEIVSAFTIGPTGALAATSPPNAPTGSNPEPIVVSNDSRHVYVGNTGGYATDALRAYDIDLTGALHANASAPIGFGGPRPAWLAVLPAQAPVASFTAGPARAGLPSAFDGSASSDPDGAVARYDWDFGDGQTLPDGGPAPTHVYAAPGDYTVSLTVTDDESCSTQQRYTGQTMSCNGKPTARMTRVVTVPAAGPDLAAWLALLGRPHTTAPDAGATPAAVPAAAPKAPATPRRCVVPRLRGRTHGDARRALIRAGCRLALRGKVRAGRVVWQSRRAGTKLKRGSRVTVVLRRRR
jgi:DNA-binding beta-propeller fold protein YncE